MSIPHAVLALVGQGVGSPSELRREFGVRTGEVWPVNRGQIATLACPAALGALLAHALQSFLDRLDPRPQ